MGIGVFAAHTEIFTRHRNNDFHLCAHTPVITFSARVPQGQVLLAAQHINFTSIITLWRGSANALIQGTDLQGHTFIATMIFYSLFKAALTLFLLDKKLTLYVSFICILRKQLLLSVRLTALCIIFTLTSRKHVHIQYMCNEVQPWLAKRPGPPSRWNGAVQRTTREWYQDGFGFC